MGLSEEIRTEYHKQVADLSSLGDHDKALQKALGFACIWAFVAGYKIVFDARIGVLPVYPRRHLTIFLSFPKTIDMSSIEDVVVKSEPEDPVDKSGLEEGDCSAENVQLVGNKAGEVQAEVAETQQNGWEVQYKHMPNAIKRWVAEVLLHMMLRCYGSITFPGIIWVMEDWVDDKPPSLLLPSAWIHKHEPESADEVREYIIEKIDALVLPSSIYPTGLEQ